MDRQNTVQQLEAKLRENPNALVFARLADLYLQEKRFDEAINLCLKGLKAHSGYITGNFILGKAYWAKGDFEKAESEFKKVLTYDRTFLAAHKTLGDLMAQMGWENKAFIHYRDLLSSDPLEEDVRQIIETMAPAETSFAGDYTSAGTENASEKKPWTEELEEVFINEPEKPSTGAEPPAADFTGDSLNDFDFLDEPNLTLDIDKLPDEEDEFLFESEDPAEEPEPRLSVPESPADPADDLLFDPEDELLSSPPKAEEEIGKEPLMSETEQTAEPEAWEELIREEDVKEEKSENHDGPHHDPTLENEIIETIQELEEKQTDSETPAETAPEEKPPSEPAEPSAKPNSKKKIVSTTLGDIFAAQGQFDKALEVYETLLASDPQNKRFQDKIAELKQIIRETGL